MPAKLRRTPAESQKGMVVVFALKAPVRLPPQIPHVEVFGPLRPWFFGVSLQPASLNWNCRKARKKFGVTTGTYDDYRLQDAGETTESF